MILTVIQTPVSLIVTLLVQITVQGKKKKQDKKEIRWKTSAVKCLLSRPISLWVLFLFSHRMLLEIKQAH